MTETFRNLFCVIASWSDKQFILQPESFASSAKVQPVIPSNTWASIAATEPVGEDKGIIKFTPNDAIKRTITPAEERATLDESQTKRVLWVAPWPESRPLSEVSDRIHEIGALYSIAFAPDAGAVCLIFQYVEHATRFYQDCITYQTRKGASFFGNDISVTWGQPYPTDEGIRAMDGPRTERRRLTFAMSQLFNKVTHTQFRRDIENVVGSTNIERFWLFNTGNATVVFTAVPLAKLVSQSFKKRSKDRNSPYFGMQVSFSHDPCERNLHLVSQIPGHANYIGVNGNGSHAKHSSRSGRSSTFSTDSSYDSRRPSTASSEKQPTKRRVLETVPDEEGWQTVRKRH